MHNVGGQLVLPCLHAVQPPAGWCQCVGEELAVGRECMLLWMMCMLSGEMMKKQREREYMLSLEQP